MKRKKLTAKQAKMLYSSLSYKNEHGEWPTFDELSQEMGITSTALQKRAKAIRDKKAGYIARRGTRLLEKLLLDTLAAQILYYFGKHSSDLTQDEITVYIKRIAPDITDDDIEQYIDILKRKHYLESDKSSFKINRELYSEVEEFLRCMIPEDEVTSE